MLAVESRHYPAPFVRVPPKPFDLPQPEGTKASQSQPCRCLGAVSLCLVGCCPAQHLHNTRLAWDSPACCSKRRAPAAVAHPVQQSPELRVELLSLALVALQLSLLRLHALSQEVVRLAQQQQAAAATAYCSQMMTEESNWPVASGIQAVALLPSKPHCTRPARGPLSRPAASR